jgi:hypothetical protein
MNLSRKILAGAVIALLPLTGAMACTTSAWSATTGTVNAASPTGSTDASPKRYAALCGLQTTGGTAGYVTSDHANDGTYRARFYVFTGTPSAAGRVFSATAQDAGAGAEVIAVILDPSSDTFNFVVNGTNVGSAPAVDRKWYGIEMAFMSGASFSATVKTSNVADIKSSITTTVNAAAAPAAATVGSARIGNIDGVAASPSALNFDEFDSSRSASTAIGFLCRGDANNSGGVTATDRTAITQELALPPTLASGTPDCNEDGRVTATDRTCVTEKLTIIGNAALQCN